MMTRLLASAFLLLALSSTAAAQAPFPGGVLVNGGWVPCTHPIAIDAGLGCVAGGPVTTPKPGDVKDGQIWVCFTSPYQYGQPNAEQLCSWVPVNGPGSQAGTGGPKAATVWEIGRYYTNPYRLTRLVAALVFNSGRMRYRLVSVSPGPDCGTVSYWDATAPLPYVWAVDAEPLPDGCAIDPSAFLEP